MLELGHELTGTLQPGGSILLDEPPAMPPGRVRITLTPMPVRMPDEPLLDECISAPCDLPYAGPVNKVKVRYGQTRLSEILEVSEETAA